MSINSNSEEEEKVVNISKNEDFNKDYEGDQEEEDFNQNQNPIENPSVIHNYSQEEDLFQSQSRDQLNKDKNESNLTEKVFEPRKWQWAFPMIEGVPPCPRGGHTAVLSGASIVIFGGHYYAGKDKGYVYLNDTYILDVNANRWNKPKISGTPPAPRYNHSAILAGSRIIIFGGKGENNVVFRDLHALDPVTMTWYQGPEGSGSPSARFGHSASLVNGSKMLIFGGWNGKLFYNDLYLLDLEVMAWSQPKCTGPAPSPRQGHTAIQVGTNLIIQGGFMFDEEKQMGAGFRQGTQLRACYLNDIRILDTENFIWSRLRVSGTPPLPRYGHTSNISGSDIVVFGGWTLKSGSRSDQNVVLTASSDIDYFLVLNTDNMSWEKGKFIGVPPLNRYGHTSTSIGPHILIFGGWEFSRATNEPVVMRDMSVSAANKSKNNKI